MAAIWNIPTTENFVPIHHQAIRFQVAAIPYRTELDTFWSEARPVRDHKKTACSQIATSRR